MNTTLVWPIPLNFSPEYKLWDSSTPQHRPIDGGRLSGQSGRIVIHKFVSKFTAKPKCWRDSIHSSFMRERIIGLTTQWELHQQNHCPSSSHSVLTDNHTINNNNNIISCEHSSLVCAIWPHHKNSPRTIDGDGAPTRQKQLTMWCHLFREEHTQHSRRTQTPTNNNETKKEKKKIIILWWAMPN